MTAALAAVERIAREVPVSLARHQHRALNFRGVLAVKLLAPLADME
jgi:hypothetical protein